MHFCTIPDTSYFNPIKYEYDATHRLSKVVENGEETHLSYDANGNRIEIVHANGTRIKNTFNTANQLTSVRHVRSDNTLLASFDYLLDQNGRRIKATETLDQHSRTIDYQYDQLGRLLSEQVTENGTVHRTQYRYDVVGNRVEKDEAGRITRYVYDDNDRLMSETHVGVTTHYHYDSHGNLIEQRSPSGSITYQWNSQHQLIGVNEGNRSTTYSYNPAGHRNKRLISVGGVTTETQYLIDSERPYSEIAATWHKVGAVAWDVTRYLHTADGVGELLAEIKGSSKTSYHADGQGSTRLTTASDGSIVDRLSFDAFGNRVNALGGTATAADQIRHQYVGEYQDYSTGLYQLRARWMNPQTGRFISMDLFEGVRKSPLSLNKYIYANSDPVNVVDPSGYFGLISLSLGSDFSMSLNVGRVQTGRIIVKKIGCELAEALVGQAIDYGIYILTDGLGNWYVGQSVDIEKRLKAHLRSKAKEAFQVVGKFFVNGGKDELRRAEQYMMDLVSQAIKHASDGGKNGSLANSIRAIKEKGGRLSNAICK